MIQQIIKVPIFPSNIRIILAEKITDIAQNYNIPIESSYDSFVWDEGAEIVIALSTDCYLNPSTVIHEIIHVKNAIFEYSGTEYLSVKQDETEAYLTQWVYSQVIKFLEKHKPNDTDTPGDSKIT